MHQSTGESHAVKLAALTDVLEQRSARAVQATEQAAQRLGQSASVLEQATAKALESFRREAATVLAEGMRQPLQQAGEALLSGCQNTQSAMFELKKQIDSVKRLHVAHALWAFVALVIASLAVVGVTIYAGMKARQDIRRAEWVSDINAAIDRGVLATCPEGGVCVYVDKKWVHMNALEPRQEPDKHK